MCSNHLETSNNSSTPSRGQIGIKKILEVATTKIERPKMGPKPEFLKKLLWFWAQKETCWYITVKMSSYSLAPTNNPWLIIFNMDLSFLYKLQICYKTKTKLIEIDIP